MSLSKGGLPSYRRACTISQGSTMLLFEWVTLLAGGKVLECMHEATILPTFHILLSTGQTSLSTS